MTLGATDLFSCARAIGSDGSGAVLIKAALTLPVLLGFAGLGIDTGLWYYDQRRMQTAADAAAMAAAYALNRESATYAEYVAVARNDAAANGFIHGVNAQVDVPVSTDGTTVDVTVEGPGDLFFARMFADAAPAISVVAAASAVGGSPCLIALHLEQPGSAAMNGTPDVLADGCSIHVNSRAPEALDADGTPIMRADAICVNGGWSESTTAYSPQPHHCSPIPDPLATLPDPTVNPTCLDSSRDQYNRGTIQLYPGTYCHGIDIGGNATVVLAPGIYVLRDEGLSLRGRADLFGDGVMFYLTRSTSVVDQESSGRRATGRDRPRRRGSDREGASGSDAAGDDARQGREDPVIDLGGTGDLTLRAAMAGTYGGILVFQDRSLTEGVDHTFRGTSNATFRGTIYLPTQDVVFVGTSDAVTELPFITIVSTFQFSGTSAWRFTAGSTPSSPLPVLLQPRISLVE